ncbi:DUF378 domain-containing protein [Candidatus Babeliales bacterium]|nr:DUF378 domain-containing protein [Candidatus Babeliales bacterium]
MIFIMNWIAYFLSSIGAINWGLVAFFNFNLIDYFCNLAGRSNLNKLFYAIIAIAGFYSLISLFRG